MQIVNWLRSPQGEDARLVLEVAVSVLAFWWLLKNHKIIRE
tara:strand:+ start:9867 stop:9989 length:123 start_codon:yes stop_codon:yes gene_type:complete